MLQAQGVRIIDAAGGLSYAGLVQVHTDVGFGTICGMNQAAADVVCKQLGYGSGVASDSPCESYGGSDICGAPGSPVAMQSLKCTGAELALSECEWSVPDTSCSSHGSDAVVFCTGGAMEPQVAIIIANVIHILLRMSTFVFAQEGALRLLDDSGAPSIDGVGRLEVFLSGRWAPVCSEGFGDGAAAVACKSMGFSGVEPMQRDCVGVGLCGAVAPQLSDVKCVGSEGSLLSCPHLEGDDVYCAPEESVVVHCVGDGDAVGLAKAAVAPQWGVALRG